MIPVKESCGKVRVKRLLELIPDEELSKLSSQTKVDHYTKVLYGKSMFYLLLYGLASTERTSLRGLEDVFNSRRFKFLFSLDPAQSTRYNSISPCPPGCLSCNASFYWLILSSEYFFYRLFLVHRCHPSKPGTQQNVFFLQVMGRKNSCQAGASLLGIVCTLLKHAFPRLGSAGTGQG